MDLKEILKPIFDFVKEFMKPKQKTSTTIIIHVDKIEVNVTSKE